jgi:hypothetical protein
MGMIRHISILLGLVVTLVVPAVAFGGNQSSTPSDGGSAQGALSSGGEGSLPFTGLNLALIVLAGVALVATGLLLRRRARSNES